MPFAASAAAACLFRPVILPSSACSPANRSSAFQSSAGANTTISFWASRPILNRCTALHYGHQQRQPVYIRPRVVHTPCRPARHNLHCVCCSAAGSNPSGSFQSDDTAGPALAATAQSTSQPQQSSQPGFLHQQLARIHLESALRRDDFRQTLAAVARHLQGQARTSTPRNVVLTWLALPFLLIGIALRTPIQLLAGFHRERLIRLRLLRWVAKRSAVLKLSKATQADPANAEKYVSHFISQSDSAQGQVNLQCLQMLPW